MPKGLTGDDATVLALLAQAPKLASDDQKKLVASLRGEARKIALALVGMTSVGRAGIAADAFRSWARELVTEGGLNVGHGKGL
jgi:hypothetical protein